MPQRVILFSLILKALIPHSAITMPFLARLGFGRQNMLNLVVLNALSSHMLGPCFQLVVLATVSTEPQTWWIVYLL